MYYDRARRVICDAMVVPKDKSAKNKDRGIIGASNRRQDVLNTSQLIPSGAGIGEVPELATRMAKCRDWIDKRRQVVRQVCRTAFRWKVQKNHLIFGDGD